MLFIIKILLFLALYIFMDYMLGEEIKGKYYLIHSINNMIIVYLTLPALIHTYTNFDKFYEYNDDLNSVILTYSLHIYHIIVYFKKLRFDDWLHHILMIFVVMPLSILLEGGYLLGHGLFFLTGLPGSIDYLLLFLVRNDILAVSWFQVIACWVTTIIVYWNGIYFMNQVVENYALERNKLKY